MRAGFLILAVIVILTAAVLWPQADLIVSGWFYQPGHGFPLSGTVFFEALHFIAHAGSRLLGLALLVFLIVSASQNKPTLGLDTKAWLFLFLGLLLGPALVVNGVFKDHWGRARPREVTEFGGQLHFSPAGSIQNECHHNCSFVSGDGSFGFFLPAFAYVVAPARSRRYFWGGIGAGILFSFSRIAVGAHFLSDVLFAAFFTQGIVAVLHGCMYGWQKTRACWHEWLFFPEK
jgi:lipid A 4'-phosphatase